MSRNDPPRTGHVGPRGEVPRSQVPRSQVPPSASLRSVRRSPSDPDLPVEVTAHVTRTTVRRGAAAMLVMLIVLALFNASALERYIANYSGSTLAEELLVQAGHWSAAMERIGFDGSRNVVRARIEEFRALRFGEAEGQ
ncbi:MAG: hypothetical protein GC150_05355 [Rhizobiales bacterium]|nr:hypothetical protein [Hyphomicrobiales bacterium]